MATKYATSRANWLLFLSVVSGVISKGSDNFEENSRIFWSLLRKTNWRFLSSRRQLFPRRPRRLSTGDQNTKYTDLQNTLWRLKYTIYYWSGVCSFPFCHQAVVMSSIWVDSTTDHIVSFKRKRKRNDVKTFIPKRQWHSTRKMATTAFILYVTLKNMI